VLILEAEDPAGQERLGAALALVCPRACIVYLEGDLGSGKTTLVRGFLRGMGYQGKVRSPTYTLLEPYEFNDRTVYHLDLYRLADPEELEYLGLRDLLETDAVLLIEWPARGRGVLPAADLRVNIQYRQKGRRLELAANTRKGSKVIQDLAQGLGAER
jgi:tRNA threonylcarbamoyladenosine biosynthesis protein TsaE